MRIDQSLHGYLDGHQLLQASLTLPSRAAWEVLKLSDLAGTVVRSFDGYITAYPVPETDLYAFAKTWYAYELPRPGCVWTHTLYLPASVVEGIALDSVERLFVRPGEGADYSQPLVLEADPHGSLNEDGLLNSRLSIPIDHSILVASTYLLYGKGDTTLLFAAEASEQYKPLFYALWKQSWPSLRMKISFCTGGADVRYLGNEPLMLQALTPSAANVGNRRLKAKAQIVDKALPIPERDLPWAEFLADDLLETYSTYRHTLYGVGRLLPSKRTSMSEVARLLLRLPPQSAFGIESVIQAIETEFTSPRDGYDLKRLVIAGAIEGNAFIGANEAGHILDAIVSSEHPDAFVDFQAELRDLVASLSTDDAYLAQLANRTAQCAAVICSEIRRFAVEELVARGSDLAAIDRDVLLDVLASSEVVANAVDLERLSEKETERIFDALSHAKGERFDEIGRTLIRKEIRRPWRGTAEVAYRYLPTLSTEEVLSSIDGGETVRDSWLRPLSNHLDAVAVRLRTRWPARSRVLEEVARAIKRARQVSAREVSAWLDLVATFQEGDREALEAAATLGSVFAMSQNSGPHREIGELLLSSFDVVDSALSRDRLKGWEWDALVDWVPGLGWYDDWDHCRRYRLGAFAAAQRHWLPVRDLISSISEESRRVQVRRLYDSTL